MGIFDFFRKRKESSDKKRTHNSPKKTSAPFSEIVGELHPTWIDPDIYFSEPLEIPYFDKEMLAIGIGAADHKESLYKADKALANFMNLNATDRLSDTPEVLNYYKTCLNHGMSKKLEIKDDNDIWNYVTPTEIMVESISGEGTLIMVNCECEWEQEHGLMLTFKNGKELISVGGIE